jgi:hypothetical protein
MTADQAEMVRLVCALTPRVVRRTRAEVSMLARKYRCGYDNRGYYRVTGRLGGIANFPSKHHGTDLILGKSSQIRLISLSQLSAMTDVLER